MASQQRLLEGDVIDNGDERLESDRLRDELARATRERDALRADNVRLRQRVNQVDGPVAQLRQTLEPLYRSLQALWGDIEVIDPQEPSSAAVAGEATRGVAVDGRVKAIWESWKQKLGGQCAKIIDVLMVHPEMNTTQLAIAIQTSRQNIPNLIYKLNQAGLINKNGGKFSLKQI